MQVKRYIIFLETVVLYEMSVYLGFDTCTLFAVREIFISFNLIKLKNGTEEEKPDNDRDGMARREEVLETGQQLRVGLRGIDQSGGAGPGDCDIGKQHGTPTDQLRVGRDCGSQWTGQRRTLLLLHQGL